jgi:hypothetical protein
LLGLVEVTRSGIVEGFLVVLICFLFSSFFVTFRTYSNRICQNPTAFVSAIVLLEIAAYP